jgi:hypothetical protein
MNKALIIRINKEFKTLNIKRTNTTMNTWANELNTKFSEVQVANKYEKNFQHAKPCRRGISRLH